MSKMNIICHLSLMCSSSSLSNEVIPGSLVISSQISGYDGGEFNMDTNESVELTFPIKVIDYKAH